VKGADEGGGEKEHRNSILQRLLRLLGDNRRAFGQKVDDSGVKGGVTKREEQQPLPFVLHTIRGDHAKKKSQWQVGWEGGWAVRATKTVTYIDETPGL